MSKSVWGLAMAAALLLGSGLTVCAEEAAPESAPQQVQNYQSMMTPEILASYEVGLDNMDEHTFVNAFVRRTDVWGTLQDADGDGIDDRDPINGCGYLDLNCNGFDDRFEMAVIGEVAQKDAGAGSAMQTGLNLLSHSCRHGVIYSEFMLDEELNTYWSMPAYFFECPECEDSLDEILDDMTDAIDAIETIDNLYF